MKWFSVLFIFLFTGCACDCNRYYQPGDPWRINQTIYRPYMPSTSSYMPPSASYQQPQRPVIINNYPQGGGESRKVIKREYYRNGVKIGED